MLNTQKATVLRVLSARPGALEILVSVGGQEQRAVNYTGLTGVASPGDEVLVNTTAVDLSLGTGGLHFVICNLSRPDQRDSGSGGHIMKLRYAPHQHSVLSVEEDDLANRGRIRDFGSLEGMPVVCCELHSQIAPAAAAVKALAGQCARVAYVMTDGGALPISFSRLAHQLREKGVIDRTITCGQAFGGEIEAINLYTGLIAAKQVANTDVAIVCQGPGNAGTGSKWGFSGIEQGEAINACNTMGGRAIAVIRLSFADARERHHGLSHHTLTVLSNVALSPALVPLPEMAPDRLIEIKARLEPCLARAGHTVCTVNAEAGLAELERMGIRVTTMGRSVSDDREFFLAASAGGVVAADMLSSRL